MRAWRLAGAVALVSLAGALLPVGPARAASPPAAEEAALALGPQGGDATLAFALRLAQPGEVYAKVLATPWNPLLPGGVPNGTVAPDRASGGAGWWVRLALHPAEGPAIDLGHFADGAPTRAVPLPAGEHALQARVHAPPDAGPAGMRHRVDLAWALRDGAGGFDDASTLTAWLDVQEGPRGAGAPGWLGLLLGLGAACLLGALGVRAARTRFPRRHAWL